MPLEKVLKYFGMKHPKVTTPKWGGGGGVRLQVPFSSSQCAFLFPKNTLLFLELPFYLPELSFYFPGLPFYFPEVPFCFLELAFCFLKVPFYGPEMLFCLSKMTNVFQNCPLDFRRYLLFISCACLFPWALFFSRWFNLLLVLLRAAQRDNIFLVLFPLETLY